MIGIAFLNIDISFKVIADVTVLVKITKFRAIQKEGHDRASHTVRCCDGRPSSCHAPCSPLFHFCIT